MAPVHFTHKMSSCILKAVLTKVFVLGEHTGNHLKRNHTVGVENPEDVSSVDTFKSLSKPPRQRRQLGPAQLNQFRGVIKYVMSLSSRNVFVLFFWVILIAHGV